MPETDHGTLHTLLGVKPGGVHRVSIQRNHVKLEIEILPDGAEFRVVNAAGLVDLHGSQTGHYELSLYLNALDYFHKASERANPYQ
jgi:hypothetical protein